MPIYEYKCANCEYEKEELQSINVVSHTMCPRCELPELKRLISTGSFRLKGSGWTPKHYWQGQK